MRQHTQYWRIKYGGYTTPPFGLPANGMFQLRYGAKLREGWREERQIASNAGLWVHHL